MEEVARLQATFKQLQKGEAKQRLSERNCVDIVLKLLELKKISLIFTNSGKEYLTLHQLELEIQDALLEHGGRLNVLELPTLLNVDSKHVDAKVNEMVKKDDQIQFVQGELITKYYLDRVAEEIEEALQESGQISLTDLSKRFGIYADFLSEVITSRLGRSIRGQLDGDVLYTQSYVDRYAARVRGIFTALTRPTPMHQIINKHRLEENLFYTVMEKLIEDGRLGGIVQGRREKSQFVPAIYSHARKQWLESFFEQNGYVDYQTLEKLQLTDGRSFLATRYPDGLALPSMFIGREIVHRADEAVDEAISSSSFVDVTTVLPSCLSAEDAFLILQQCSSLKSAQAKVGGAVILEDCFVVSGGLIDRCLKLFEEAFAERSRSQLASSVGAGGAPSAPEPSKKDKLKRSSGIIPADDEDDLASSAGKKGKRRGKRDDELKTSKGTASGGKKKGAKESQEQPSAADDREANLELLWSWLEESGAEEKLIEALLTHLSSALRDMKERLARNVFLGNSSKHKALEEDIGNTYLNLQLFKKSNAELGASSDESEAMERHLVRTVCADLVNSITRDQALAHFIDVEEITPNNRAEVLAKLPASVVKPLEKLAKVKRVDEFIGELVALAQTLQIQLKSLDKKAERAAAFAHRQQLMAQLEREEHPSAVFQLVVLILYHKHCHAALHVPPKLLTTVLERLKLKLPAEIGNQLVNAHTAVQELLAAKKADDDPEAKEAAGHAELVDGLKKLALGAKGDEKDSKQPSKPASELE